MGFTDFEIYLPLKLTRKFPLPSASASASASVSALFASESVYVCVDGWMDAGKVISISCSFCFGAGV